LKTDGGGLTSFDLLQMTVGGRLERVHKCGRGVDINRLWDMDMEVVVVVEDVRAQLVTQGGHRRMVVGVVMRMTRVTHLTH